MLSGRLFQSLGPAEASDRSPTVTRRDGRTMSGLEVDERRRLRDEISNATQRVVVSDIAIFVLERDVKLQPTNSACRRGVAAHCRVELGKQ